MSGVHIDNYLSFKGDLLSAIVKPTLQQLELFVRAHIPNQEFRLYNNVDTGGSPVDFNR